MTLSPTRAFLVILALSFARAIARGQTPRQAGRGVVTSSRDVRAELATTLLNAGRFDEAATEYRRLLVADPHNRTYRLGLGRALAWGNHPREAERELVAARDRQNAVAIEPLLRSVRAAFDATATQAAGWLKESPHYLPYRVALARALAREDPWRATAQFDTLRMAAVAGAPDVPPELTLLREEIDAYLATGSRAPAIALLGVALDQAPADTAFRRSMAAALFGARMFGASRAEYDTLIAATPTANAYLGRAVVALAVHDTIAAQQDLERSVALTPSYDAYFLMASLAREHEDFLSARLLYDVAHRAAPNTPARRAVSAARAALARQDRPVIAFIPELNTDPGWSMTAQSAADNAHVSYVEVDARWYAPLRDGVVSDFGVGARRIAQSVALGPPAATGSDASLGIAGQFTLGRTMFGAGVHGGFVAHPGIATFGRGALSLAGWFDAWALALDVSRAPAYEALFTPTALALPGGETPALIANAAALSTGGPIGPLDAAAKWTRTWLSDGNMVKSIDADVRFPMSDVSPHLFAVYEGTLISSAAPTTLYWDPVHYLSNAAGPELAVHRAHGLSLSARVLAGYATASLRDTARTDVAAGPRGRRQSAPLAPLMRQSAIQLSTGSQVSYRAASWESFVDVTYSRTRAGSYQRLGANVAIRLLR